jgi:hypothetical protein
LDFLEINDVVHYRMIFIFYINKRCCSLPDDFLYCLCILLFALDREILLIDTLIRVAYALPHDYGACVEKLLDVQIFASNDFFVMTKEQTKPK